MRALWFAMLLAGCAGHVWKGADQSTGAAVEARPGKMPDGQTFSGKYQSTAMGKPLELEQQGSKITGRWTRPNEDDCLVSGALDGEADANVIEFRWQEDHSSCGHGKIEGKGWAIYRVIDGDARPRLYGEREKTPWQAIKMTETSTAR